MPDTHPHSAADRLSASADFTAAPTLETREREGAQRRADSRAAMRAVGQEPLRGAYTGVARASVAARAFAALADNVRDYGVFLMNPHGVITFWGEGARLIKWWTRDEAEGAHLRLLYPDGGSEDGTAEAHLVEAAERGEYSGEGQRIRRDGSTFWAGVTLTALRDSNGTLLGFAKTSRDLTARRAADALLQAAAQSADDARAAAVAADLLKSGFLATISHEIRTPVNAILGYHQLLQMEIDGPLSPQQHAQLRRASASGRHLLTLITDVLDFSRIDSGQAGVQTGAFRIGDAIASALELVVPQAQERGVVINNSLSGRALRLMATGDEASARQILVNLLTNAIKFSPPSGMPITISVGASAVASPETQLTTDGPWVYVRVEDAGPGIPQDRIEAMYEPFVQGDMTLTRHPGGTGLGLAISRRLARLMQGDITAQSEVGVGSAFIMWLPAASQQQAESGPPDPLAEAGSGSDDLRSVTAIANVSPALSDGSQAFADLGAAILGDIDRILHGYVARLRSDPLVQGAKALTEAQLQDHLSCYLTDIASTISGADPVNWDADASIADGASIQRVVSDRHGAQRARLGWTRAEVQREFVVLGDEIVAALRRHAPVRQPSSAQYSEQLERAVGLLNRFLSQAETISLASHARTAATVQDGAPYDLQNVMTQNY